MIFDIIPWWASYRNNSTNYRKRFTENDAGYFGNRKLFYYITVLKKISKTKVLFLSQFPKCMVDERGVDYNFYKKKQANTQYPVYVCKIFSTFLYLNWNVTYWWCQVKINNWVLSCSDIYAKRYDRIFHLI